MDPRTCRRSRNGSRIELAQNPEAVGFRAWLVLGGSVVAQTSSASVNVGVVVLAPAIQSRFHLTLSQLGVVLAAVNAGITSALIPWGMLVDRFGERAGVGLGLGGAIVGLVAAATSHSFGVLCCALLVAGMCTAAVLPSTGASLMHWFPPGRRGLVIGIRHGGTTVGGLLAALVLPGIATAHGLRWAFLALTIPCAASAVVAAGLFGEPAVREPVATSSRIAAFHDRTILRLAWSGFAFFATQSAIVSFAVVLLHGQRSMSAADAAKVLAAIQVGGALLRLGVGRWSDRVGARVSPLRTLAVLTAAAVAAAAAATSAPLALTVVAFVIAGSVGMSSTALLFTATAEAAPPGRIGAALGFQQTILGLAATATPVAFAATVSATSWSVGLAVAAALPLVSFALLSGRLRSL